jgi:hypothetical protein
MKCQAITQKGTQCSFNAKNGSFCGRHTPVSSSSTDIVKTSKGTKVKLFFDPMEILRILKERDENLIGRITDFLFNKKYIQKCIRNEFSFISCTEPMELSLIKKDEKNICYLENRIN